MTEKRVLRKELLLLRRDLGEEYRRSASRAIVERIAESDVWQTARVILAYSPVGEELFLNPLWERALAEGKSVAFPRCEEGEMRFLCVSSLSELKEDAYRIPAPPKAGREVRSFEEALAVVPALAVDSEGFRLGYGGGYYDRFLKTHPEVFSLCAVYDLHFLSTLLPREPFDVPVRQIVSEKRNTGVL